MSDRESTSEPGGLREEASFGKVQALMYREASRTALEGGPEYMIDFVDQDHAFKPSKLLNGLTQFYNDVLRDHSRKQLQLVRIESGGGQSDQRSIL